MRKACPRLMLASAIARSSSDLPESTSQGRRTPPIQNDAVRPSDALRELLTDQMGVCWRKMTDKLPKEASSNDLACSELGGWRPVGAALHNPGVGACDLCDGGHRDGRWRSPDQQRLVDHRNDSHGKRGDTAWLFSWNVDSTWRGFAVVTQAGSLCEERPEYVDFPDPDFVSVHLGSRQAAVPSGHSLRAG